MQDETPTTPSERPSSAVGERSKQTGTSVASATGARLTPEQVDRALAWLKDLREQRLRSRPPREVLKARLDSLMTSANRAWIAARVLSLLSHYFEKDTPAAVRQMEAEDWVHALDGQPDWAIDRAIRWWRSDANPNRHRRPLEGDLIERIKLDTQEPRFALASYDIAEAQAAQDRRQPPERPEITAESRARMAALAQETIARFRAIEAATRSEPDPWDPLKVELRETPAEDIPEEWPAPRRSDPRIQALINLGVVDPEECRP